MHNIISSHKNVLTADYGKFLVPNIYKKEKMHEFELRKLKHNNLLISFFFIKEDWKKHEKEYEIGRKKMKHFE